MEEQMSSLYVTFTAEVSDDEYSYRGKKGRAEVKIQVPREILGAIDPGNLFTGALQAALANFDKPEEDKEK